MLYVETHVWASACVSKSMSGTSCSRWWPYYFRKLGPNIDMFSSFVSQNRNSSVIRQKGKSQNGCFKKTKHTKFSEKRTFLTSWYAHVSTILPLRKKCLYSELFWSVFFSYSVRMRENTDQNTPEYGHFSRSVLENRKFNMKDSLHDKLHKFKFWL